jgi:PEP-CTERM motif-containing protein
MARRLGIVAGVITIAGLMVVAGAVFSAPPAFADTFMLSDCTQIIGPAGFACPNDTGKTTLQYQTPAGLRLDAFGFDKPATPTNLYVKQDGVDETGLGLTSPSSDHEIESTQFITLDTRMLPASDISGMLTLQSIQAGEQAEICDEATNGVFGPHAGNTCELTAVVPPGGMTQTLNVVFNGSLPWLAIDSINGDVLLASDFEVVPVPEPATMALLLTGVAGMVLTRKRRSEA